MNGQKSIKLEKFLVNFIFIGCFIALLIPLYVAKQTFFPYIVVKTIVFRTIVELIFLAWLVLAYHYPAYRLKQTRLFWMLVIFFLVMFFSTLFSQSFVRSFWGNSERMMGFFNVGHFFLWWLVLVNVLKNVKQWYRLLRFSLLVSILVAGYGLAQYFNFSFALDAGVDRVNSTIGNAAYLAGYLLLHIYLAWYFFFKSDSRFRQWFYFAVSLLLLVCLFLTATRGAQLAFFASLIIFSLSFFIFKLYQKPQAKILLVFSILIIVLGLSLVALKDQAWVKHNYYLQRFNSISLNDATLKTRLIAWQASLKAFTDKPLLGYGPENFTVGFNRYVDPDFYSYTGNEIWFDRAHNTLFDMLVMMGLFGLAGYLGIYVVVFSVLWRFYKLHGFADNVIIVGLVFLAHFIQNFFVFDSLSTYIPLFLWLGFIDYLERLNLQKAASQSQSWLDKLFAKFFKPAGEETKFALKPSVTIPIALAIFSLSFFMIQVREIRANKLMYDGMLKGTKGAIQDYGDFKEKMGQAFETAFNPSDASIIFAEVLPYFLNNHTSQISTEQKAKDLDTALGYLQKVLAIDGRSVYNHFVYAKLCMSAYEFTGDEGYLEKASRIIEEARVYAPTRIDIINLQARIYLYRNELDLAMGVLNESIELNPKLPLPYWLKYLIYDSYGQTDLGYQSAELAVERKYAFYQPEEILRVLDYFEKQGKPEPLIYLYQSLIELKIQPKERYLRLADLFRSQGEESRAQEILTKLESLEGQNLLPSSESEP